MKIKISIIAVVISLIFYGCTSSEASDGIKIKKVVLHTSSEGNQTGIFTNKNITILNSQNKYSDELLKYSSNSAELLDFSKGNVLLIDVGEITACNEIKSVNIIENETSINIAIEYQGNNPTMLCPAVMTNPYQFIWVPSKKRILVSESIEKI